MGPYLLPTLLSHGGHFEHEPTTNLEHFHLIAIYLFANGVPLQECTNTTMTQRILNRVVQESMFEIGPEAKCPS